MRKSITRSVARRAFTLMELLVVMALMGLVAGLVVMDFVGLPDRWSASSDHDSLLAAVELAHTSVPAGRVTLRYVESRRALVVFAGKELGAFPMQGTVSFLLPEDEAGGAPRALEHVVFAPEGDATPARIVLTTADHSTAYRMDPFSSAIAKESP